MSDIEIAAHEMQLVMDSSIVFTVYLPFRVQECYGIGLTVEAEHFHVAVTYSYDFPVTFIYYDASDEQDVGRISRSHAVVFIRNFLEEKLKDNSQIEFQFLGPSPFHADLFLRDLEEAEVASTKDVTQPLGGYKTILIKVPPSENEIETVIRRYQDILACFYRIVEGKNSLFHNEETLVSLTRDLVNKSKERGLFAKVKTLSRRADIVYQIFEDILSDKIERLTIDGYVNERKRGSVIDEASILYSFIDNELSEFPMLPAEEIQKIVEITEDRRQKYFDNGATLIAGLLGAIAGALLTVALTHGWSPQHRQSEGTSASAVVAPDRAPAPPQGHTLMQQRGN